jgi:hypothetical protein
MTHAMAVGGDSRSHRRGTINNTHCKFADVKRIVCQQRTPIHREANILISVALMRIQKCGVRLAPAFDSKVISLARGNLGVKESIQGGGEFAPLTSSRSCGLQHPVRLLYRPRRVRAINVAVDGRNHRSRTATCVSCLSAGLCINDSWRRQTKNPFKVSDQSVFPRIPSRNRWNSQAGC